MTSFTIEQLSSISSSTDGTVQCSLSKSLSATLIPYAVKTLFFNFLAYRERYLKMMKLEETKESYIALKRHVGEVDWEKIKETARIEKQAEK